MNEITLKLGKVCVGKRSPTCRSVPHNPNSRMHHMARYRWGEAWKEEVWTAFRSYPQIWSYGFPWERAIITVTLHAVQLPDMDNAMASMKPVVDGLKGLAIKDDSPDRCEIRIRLQKVTTKNQEHVSVHITRENEV